MMLFQFQFYNHPHHSTVLQHTAKMILRALFNILWWSLPLLVVMKDILSTFSFVGSTLFDFDQQEETEYLPNRKLKYRYYRNEKPIVYLSTPEGIMANFRQVENLWKVAIAAGRSIKVASRNMSDHYDNSLLNFCALFTVPASVSCTRKKIKEIGRSLPSCTIINSKKINVWYNQPSLYGLPRRSVPSTNIDFSIVDCLAGYIHSETISAKRSPKYFPQHELNKNYTRHLPTLFQILTNNQQNSTTTVVYHWRRGDQLSSRCNSTRKKQSLDVSVNCKGVKAFVSAANVAVGPIRTKSENRTIIRYVATNENNRTALDQLRQQGFLLFEDIEEKVKQFLEVSRLNRFLVEVLLMCHADHFFHFGFSEVHYFLRHCRTERLNRLKALTLTIKALTSNRQYNVSTT